MKQVYNGAIPYTPDGSPIVVDGTITNAGIGAPETELWMDNWCIVKDAPDPNAAHAWINFICDPEVSLKDLAYHGYNTGIVGVQEEAEAAGLEFLDLVFFSDEQVATMDPGAVNEAPLSRDTTCISAWSWLSYHVT